MKKSLAIILLLVLILVSVPLTACDDGEFTVEFYVSGKLEHTERTVDGNFSYVFELPEDMQGKAIFSGWYSDKECTKRYNGNKVTKDTKLYGRIVSVPGGPFNPGGPYKPNN